MTIVSWACVSRIEMIDGIAAAIVAAMTRRKVRTGVAPRGGFAEIRYPHPGLRPVGPAGMTTVRRLPAAPVGQTLRSADRPESR
jgi:O-acetyl-ADP-ribose deacetylase (regulator of RNase III)